MRRVRSSEPGALLSLIARINNRGDGATGARTVPGISNGVWTGRFPYLNSQSLKEGVGQLSCEYRFIPVNGSNEGSKKALEVTWT